MSDTDRNTVNIDLIPFKAQVQEIRNLSIGLISSALNDDDIRNLETGVAIFTRAIRLKIMLKEAENINL